MRAIFLKYPEKTNLPLGKFHGDVENIALESGVGGTLCIFVTEQSCPQEEHPMPADLWAIGSSQELT